MALDALKSQLTEALGQLEVLKTYYARLTDRERYIVLGSTAAGVILLLFAIYAIVAGSASRLEAQIDRGRKGLAEFAQLQAQFLQARDQVNGLERLIQRTPPSFQLATELEEIARRHGVSIDTLKERPGQPTELYRERQSTLSLKSVNLLTLLNFLHEIENSQKLMRITSLQIKTNFKDPTLLNTDIVVSTFQMKDSS